MKVRTLAIAGLVIGATSVFAQAPSDAPMGKPGSMYAKYGIHKLTEAISECVVSHSKSEVLMANDRIKRTFSMAPLPAVKFIVLNGVLPKLGGPQESMLEGLPDAFSLPKSFMMTRLQKKEFRDLIEQDLGKHEIEAADAKMLADWVMHWIDEAKPFRVEPKESFKKSDSLYARLGGIIPIALVVEEFVNRLEKDPTIGANPHTVKALTSGKVSGAGLRFLVTEQLAAATGGPFKYTGRTMKNSHNHLMIGQKEWEVGAQILKGVLDEFKVPAKEQGEIFNAIASLEKDIVKGGG